MAGTNKPGSKKHITQISGWLPPWLLVVISLCYDALLLCIWSKSAVSPTRAITIVLFTLGFAMLTALIATVGHSQRLRLATAIAVSVFWALLYLMEYFLLDAFKNYFTIGQIFSAGGNAGQEDFSARVFGLIRADFWRILVMALPFLLYAAVNGVTRKHRQPTAGIRRCLFAAGMAITAVAVFFALFISPDSKKLRAEYNFTEAADSFGLPTALLLEQLNGGGGTDAFVEETHALPREWEQTAASTQTTGASEPPFSAETSPTEADETSVPTPPPAAVPSYHVMGLNFASLAVETSDEKISSIHRYVDSLVPAKTNAMTGRFAGKNLIFITAEAFSLEVIDPELTPALYRMATEGVRFTDYYQPAWGGSTSTGEFSNLTGLIPTHGVASIQDTVGHNMYLTLGNQLRRQGYFSRAYHNNSYTYYNRDKTHENLGYEQFIGMGNGMEMGVTDQWPASDREMIGFTFPQYVDHQPFSIYYMTVSGHGLYSWGGNSMSLKNRDAVANLSCSETVQGYLAANLELEYAMEDLLAMLEQAGIADDTVIVLGADHYPYCLGKSVTWGNDRDYLEELYGFPADTCFAQDHNALLLWSGCLEGEGLEITTPVYSLDIVPTLSNLFGLEYDSRLLVGRDVFSEQAPLVLWPNHSWKTDLGCYDASSGVFTPAEGAKIPAGYAERISNAVRNKFSYSDAVLNYDYFGLLFQEE